jgi:hypothetical protein
MLLKEAPEMYLCEIQDWIALTYKAVHAVPGSVDGEEFLSFIVNDMVHCMFYLFGFVLTICQLLTMNPYPQDKSILILDNCDSQDTCTSRHH